MSNGIGCEIFGTLGTGGLEVVGEDEDEELGLADKGKGVPASKKKKTWIDFFVKILAGLTSLHSQECI